MLKKCITLLFVVVSLAACNNLNWSDPEGTPRRGPQATNQKPAPNQPITRQESTAVVPVVLDRQELEQVFAVNADQLTYKFQYVHILKDGPVNFDDQGKAALNFTGLPVGTKGDLVLEIQEAGTPKMRGTVKDLTLTAGANNHKLTLQSIGGPTPPNPNPPTVTYATVKPILDAKCVRCHSPSGSAKANVLLHQYPFTIVNTQKFPDMPSLMRRVVQTVSNPGATMPQGNPGLPAADIAKLNAWIAAGLR